MSPTRRLSLSDQRLRDKLMVADWESGRMIAAIASKYGLSPHWTARILRNNGAALPQKGRGIRVNLDEAAIERAYLVERRSTYAIAADLGVSHKTVSRILARRNVPIRQKNRLRRRVGVAVELDGAGVEADYTLAEMSIRAIAEKRGVSYGKVYAALRERNVSLRRPGRPKKTPQPRRSGPRGNWKEGLIMPRPKRSQEEVDEWAAQYNSGKSLRRISADAGVAYSTVHLHITGRPDVEMRGRDGKPQGRPTGRTV